MPQAIIHTTWRDVDPTAWDKLVGEQSPFLEHGWMGGMELAGCATPDTGWHPRPVVVRDPSGAIVGGAPAWQLDHSLGQYVWEQRWVEACTEANLEYFPKLALAVPYTPVAGARVLHNGDPTVLSALLKGVAEASKDSHSVHVLFPKHGESDDWVHRNAFQRRQYQYHWTNRQYADFDAFLARFRSARRKEIRRERRAVQDLTFEVHEQPGDSIFELLWRCYDATVDRYDNTDRYLTQAFFEHLSKHFAHRVVAFVAKDGDEPVGAALNVVKGDRMYGRYWGQLQQRRFLHFELCYHRPVAYAIERGLHVYEPGHGGEHKFRRGFEPAHTWSNHTFKHRGAQSAFKRYAEREQSWMRDHVRSIMERSPLKA